MKKLLLLNTESLITSCTEYTDRIHRSDYITTVTADEKSDELKRMFNDIEYISSLDKIILLLTKDVVDFGSLFIFLKIIKSGTDKLTILISTSDIDESDEEELDWIINAFSEYINILVCDDEDDLRSWFTQTCKQYF